MDLSEKITELAKDLSEKRQNEVIDFIEFLKQQQLKEDMEIMDKIFEENEEVMEKLAK
ncbi:DUF2281 domain-containing protein [Clostridium sp. UBA1056]|uniref:DUF2281 domain-containing protein n=1 Tax=unclassified Clostridium TaxID=2614128 RepID=UPI003216D282